MVLENPLYRQEEIRNEIEELDVEEEYKELKQNRKYAYMMLRINYVMEVVISEIGPIGASYQDMVSHLPTHECRLVFFSSNLVIPSSNKICFILWGPDIAKVRDKMMIASSKDAVRKRLSGVSIEIGATDPNEVDIEAVKGKLQRL